MTVNQEMFREIHQITVEFPALHNQRAWESRPEQNGTCGTTRCIAGWAVWLKARELGLLSRKRDNVDRDLLVEVATRLGVVGAYMRATDKLYEKAGAAILGLSPDDAHRLFYDMDAARVPVRLASYAENGHDISENDFYAYG